MTTAANAKCLEAPPPVVCVQNLTKTYTMGDTQVQALCGISFRLQPGEYMAIMGQSGSGKSTLLNLLGGLDTPDAGTYWLDGHNVADYNDNQLSQLRREKLGFVFQSFNLIASLSVLENIEVPLFYAGWTPRRCRARALELAEKVGLSSRMRHRPTELSGGQRQRVAIARALANDPSLILADEPTGNLDTATSAEIMTMLDELVAEGRTVILVTHEADVALHAQRTLVLCDGHIASDRIRGEQS